MEPPRQAFPMRLGRSMSKAKLSSRRLPCAGRLLLLLSWWACGRRGSVVQAQRYVHRVAGQRAGDALTPHGHRGSAGQRLMRTSAIGKAIQEAIPAKRFADVGVALLSQAFPMRLCRSMSKAKLSSRRLPCKPHIRWDNVPTTVPHSGRESSRRAAPLWENGSQPPCRTTATPPWTSEAELLGSRA